MNYHIMVDDKFIDGFIDEAETVSNSNSNIYIIRGEKENSVHVKHPKATWASLGSEVFYELTKSINSSDKVFIHWLDTEACKFILSLQKGVPVYIPVWGGDLYDSPKNLQNWMYDKLTKRYFKSVYGKPDKWRKSPYYLLKQLKQTYSFDKSKHNNYKIKKEAFKRINYILIHKESSLEVELIKKLHNAHNIKHLPFSYNQNVDLALSLPEKIKAPDETVVIQLGNSATYTNNHLDAFQLLKKYKDENIKINIPLSYGDEKYMCIIKDEAVNYFGEKVHLIDKFISREEYIKDLTDVDIVIMFHNRSQALGNCGALLAMGKKLFIKKDNVLWDLFTRLGIKIFDANEIQNMRYEEFIKPLSKIDKEKNKKLINEAFCLEQRLNWLSQILDSNLTSSVVS